MKIDRAFSGAIERAEVLALQHVIRNAQERFAELHPALIEIAGGIAAYAGVNSPLSEAMGIGLWERAGRPEALALTSFYRERGTQPRVRITPYVDLDFVAALIELGYVPLEYENPLIADLRAIVSQRDARVHEMVDAREWSAATGSAFMDGKPCDESNMIVGLMIATPPQTTALEIRIDGKIVASGCMDVDGEIAGFFGAATAPPFRGRGLQGVLIADRAARAIERGARVGRVTTRPGTPSEQNFRRMGFAPLYTRTLWGVPVP